MIYDAIRPVQSLRGGRLAHVYCFSHSPACVIDSPTFSRKRAVRQKCTSFYFISMLKYQGPNIGIFFSNFWTKIKQISYESCFLHFGEKLWLGNSSQFLFFFFFFPSQICHQLNFLMCNLPPGFSVRETSHLKTQYIC